MAGDCLNLAFEAQPKRVDIALDPATQQHCLAFSLVVRVSIPQLLKELLKFQRQDPEGEGLVLETASSHRQAAPLLPSSEAAAPQAALASREASRQAQASQLASVDRQRPPLSEATGAAALFRAIAQGDAAAAACTIREVGTQALHQVAGPQRHTPLHVALEAGSTVDMVNMLLQARCNVDAQAADGRTPLHLAIAKYATLPPMVVRLLLSAQANLMIPDAANATPLDCARLVARQSVGSAESAVRQVLDEVSKRPTVAVAVLGGEEVLGVKFADLENKNVVFFTANAIGLYSLEQKKVVWRLDLTQLQVLSVVRTMTVNPELGTISVFLEVEESQTIQNLVIVWPTGHPQLEEPLKLSVAGSAEDGIPGARMPPVLLSSTTSAALILLVRIARGKVLCWRLNAASSQLTAEFKLTDRGGHVAMSDNGHWLAVEERAPDGARRVEVWTFQQGKKRLRRSPRRILSVDRAPESMAIISQYSDTACALAIAQETPPGTPLAPIEVLAVQIDGYMSSAYRVRQEAPCRCLSFCYESPNYLLSWHANGVVILSNLEEGKLRLSHDDPDIRSACMSSDGKLIATSVRDCFRIFRTSEEAK